MNKIKVQNRSKGTVLYKIPELNIRREFAPKEIKEVDKRELEMLAYQQGGKELIYNFLYIEDEQVLRDILHNQEEPEYWLKESMIPAWLISSTLDQFKDALEFAPLGIKDLIKDYAVKGELNDVQKRQAILDILHFDVEKAIKHNKEDKEEENGEISNSGRRSTPNYKPESFAIVGDDIELPTGKSEEKSE